MKIIHCPTKEEYIKVVDLIGWWDGEKHYDYWGHYKEKTCVRIEENGKLLSYSPLDFYRSESPQATFITAKEFINNNSTLTSYYPTEKDYLKHIYEESNKASDIINNNSTYTYNCVSVEPNKNMNIPRTLKRVLSKDLQAQYKAGLINGDLALTDKGKAEVWAILQQEFSEQLTKSAKEIIKEEKENQI